DDPSAKGSDVPSTEGKTAEGTDAPQGVQNTPQTEAETEPAIPANAHPLAAMGALRGLHDKLREAVEDPLSLVCSLLERVAQRVGSEDDLQTLYTLGTHDTVIEALRGNLDHPDVCEAAAGAIWALCAGDPVRRQGVADAGAVGPLTASLCTHRGRPDLVNTILTALTALVEAEEVEAEDRPTPNSALVSLRQESAYLFAVRAMQDHTDVPEIAGAAADFIGSMCRPVGMGPVVVSEEYEGVIVMLVISLQTHMGYASVVEGILSCFSHMVEAAKEVEGGAADMCRSIYAAGVPDLVVQALAAHKESSMIALGGVALLGMISFHTEDDAVDCALYECGLAPVLLGVVDAHLPNSRVMEAMMYSLSNLSHCDTVKHQMLPLGFETAALKVLDAHPSVAALNGNACTLLLNLAHKDPLFHPSLFSVPVMDALLSCMHRHQTDGSVVDAASGALGNISVCQGMRQHIMDKGVFQAVLAAATLHPDHPDTAAAMCELVEHLAKDDPVRQDSLRSHGCLDAVVTALSVYKDNDEVAEAGLMALANMGRQATHRDRILSLRGLDLCRTVASVHPAKPKVTAAAGLAEGVLQVSPKGTAAKRKKGVEKGKGKGKGVASPKGETKAKGKGFMGFRSRKSKRQ
ncbi:hypothetical protein KIPB_008140, partial [Kipferlia bialata]